ncbi:flavoprotein [Actinomadura adrarensis]|uniref:Flavoprotein n=1 Tax=Actinomadura adrarensis TaxID=1819600 RepID=A0ABW3CQC0_9ACTN
MRADSSVTGVDAPADLPLARGRLLMIGTGAFGVSMLPAWMAILRSWYAGLTVETILTESAQRLVRKRAIEAVTGRRVRSSFWDEEDVSHRTLAEWADLVIVVPATMNFISKTSLGITESLALYTTALAEAPVVIVPSVPERILTSAVARRHIRNLENAGFHVMPPGQGLAVSSGQVETGGMANIQEVIAFAAGIVHRGRTAR